MTQAPITDKMLERLRDYYKDIETPNCRVCGKKLNIGAIGHGTISYVCQGFKEKASKNDGLEYEDGRSFYDEHSQKSILLDLPYHTDRDVLRLIEGYKRLWDSYACIKRRVLDAAKFNIEGLTEEQYDDLAQLLNQVLEAEP